MIFNLTLAKELVNQAENEQFVVDFDLVWQWLGYSRKDSAKRKFENAGFVENLDFSQVHRIVELVQGGNTYETKFFLTIDCVKHFCMMANTDQGKQVRIYFIEAEKELRQTKQQPQLPKRDAIDYVTAAKDVENINNLSLQELLRDELIDELSVRQGKKKLPGQTEKKEYTIAKVRARELGYTTKEIGNGSGLGRYIAKNVPMAFAERVGKFEVKHYEINDQLDTQIHAYFGMKKSLIAK